MYIARILYPVEVLGPGRRIGIWFSGCPHHCKGCSNPDLWEKHSQYRISAERICQLIGEIANNNQFDGFTITGGEPFYQPEALFKLVLMMKKFTKDILVYSGYTLEELRYRKNPDIEGSISHIAVLIGGRYIEELNKGTILRGSDNQQVHILNPIVKSQYDNYLQRAVNSIQNFTIGNSVVSVGIHRQNYLRELSNRTLEKGLEERK